MNPELSNLLTKKIINLSLSGGGNFVFGQIGALVELEKFHDHIQIQNITAVSCGSIIGALYAVGYTADEIQKIFFELDFDLLICDTNSRYTCLYNKFGMYEANKLEAEIERLIMAKTNVKNCTFSQCSKKITIVATNLNFQKPAFFNRDLTPQMVLSKAVRMSIAYPILITPVLYENDLYSDGGEFIHYPITLFEDLEATIGITCVAHNENLDGTLKIRNPINSIYDYIKSVAITMNRATYVSQITSEYLGRSIIVDIPGEIASTQFSLTIDQKKLIYNAGKQAVIDQINKIIPDKKIEENITSNNTDTNTNINESDL
jgi:NTE family protein